jgi:hypothetical protein
MSDQRVAKSLSEAKLKNVSTAFLCHAHKDRDLVLGVVNLLSKAGWRVYVDWMDGSMPSKPNRVTADKIKKRIRDMDYFLFLATSNSMTSRWCPWEIGYADPYKYPENLLIIPTRDSYSTHGNEYLDLYRRIDLRSDGALAAIDPGSSFGTELRNLR